MSTVLVGGGPAASGLLTAAARTGALDALLDDGLTVVDAGPAARFGSGRLGGYLVRSDTRARVFAECAAPALGGRDTPDGLLARCESDEPVPLRLAAALLAAAGRRVLRRVRADPRAAVRSGTEVTGLRAGPDGVTLRVAGQPPIRADRVVLTVGGRPWTPPDLPAGGRLVLHSDQVLREDGYRRALAQLAGAVPRVTVVGGSHSAFAVAGLLLRAPVRWAPGAITVAHRSPVLVTYPDGAAARAEGLQFGADQVCPATGMVHRFGGLRADAAGLYQRVRRGTESRVRLVRVPAGWDWFADVARDDPVVVAATGYASAATGLLDCGARGGCGALGDDGALGDGRGLGDGGGLGDGRARRDGGGAWWDGEGRLRTACGDLVPQVFGLGLGTRRPRGPRTGGEPAFQGAIDGVWFYQNVVAPEVLSLVLSGGSLG